MTHITRIAVTDSVRTHFFAMYFGNYEERAEKTFYAHMKSFYAPYRGSPWFYYQLSNNGFYLAPNLESNSIAIEIPSNGYVTEVSPDATGIICTHYVLEYLANYSGNKLFGVYLELLHDFAKEHPESIKILKAISQV